MTTVLAGRKPVQPGNSTHKPILAYSLDEAAIASSLSRKTLMRRISDGTLKATKVCGRVVIPASALAALVGEA